MSRQNNETSICCTIQPGVHLKMASLAKTLCGRRQQEEPQEEVVVPAILSEEERRAQQQHQDLFVAIEKCDLVRIKELKERFSFKDIKDNHGRTPLHLLADLKVKDEVLKEIFIILKEAGCDVNSVDEFGNTAIKLAAEKGCKQVLKCLLEEKADTELSDKHKQDTPLHWAAKQGMFDAIKLLIEHKAHLNPQNKDKQTPLHLAVQKKHVNIVYLLLFCGADKKLKDKNGFTPLDIAKRADNKEITDLLNKSLQELYDMRAKEKNGRGEYVEPDSGYSDSVPWTTLTQACPIVNIDYYVNVGGHAIAAIGPNAKVDCGGQNTVSQPASLAPSSTRVPIQPSLPPAQSPSTARCITASPSAAVVSTAPLSPTDTEAPPPSAPPEEEENFAS